jgi:phosphoribosylanthranilate isomerase
MLMRARSPFVKICCISSREEADEAVALGAAAVGLVSAMPSGPGVIDEDRIAAIARHVGDRAETVLLTSETDPAAIGKQVAHCNVSGVQLCAWLDDAARKDLRARLQKTMLMQVVHVVDESSVDRAESASLHVDRLLLDSGTLDGPVQELGGTGRTHDWALSRAIVDRMKVPVLLAGGLHAGNAGIALGTVRPFGLDVCSGVRSRDQLDRTKLAAFFQAVDKHAPM